MRGYCQGTNVQQLSSVVLSDGLWKDATVAETLDTAGGRLCYVYE